VRKHLPALGENKNYVNVLLVQDHVPLASGHGMITVPLLNKEMKIHPTFLSWSVYGKRLTFFF